MEMWTDLRQFDKASKWATTAGKGGPGAVESLLQQQAQWNEEVRDYKAAAAMYLGAGQNDKAIAILAKHCQDWAHLLEVSRKLERCACRCFVAVCCGGGERGRGLAAPSLLVLCFFFPVTSKTLTNREPQCSHPRIETDAATRVVVPAQVELGLVLWRESLAGLRALSPRTTLQPGDCEMPAVDPVRACNRAVQVPRREGTADRSQRADQARRGRVCERGAPEARGLAGAHRPSRAVGRLAAGVYDRQALPVSRGRTARKARALAA